MTIFSPTTAGEFSTAITDCTFGDTIILDKNTIYETATQFLFPNKGVGTNWITITTSDLSALPTKLAAYPTNYSFTNTSLFRITTAEAANMPKVRAAGSDPAISFATGSHHWKFIGIEILNKDTGTNSTMLVGTTTAAEQVPDMAHHLYFDRCFIHPFEEVGDVDTNYHLRSAEKGFIMNGSDFTWTHCAVQGFTGWNRYPVGSQGTTRMDTNAILIGAGSGNWQIDHCLLEGQANNIWPGGGGNQGAPTAHTATMSSPTVTSGTLSQSTDLIVGDLFAVYDDTVHSQQITTNDDPDGASPGAVVSGWAVGRVATKNGNDITFDNLTTAANYRLYRIKFGTGVTGGTFTITYSGQTTANITVPTVLTVTGASNTNPVEITTSTAHGLSNGDYVSITGISGNTAANNIGSNSQWLITSTGTDTFTIPVTGNGTYDSGGIVKNRSLLASRVQTALENLSNIVPADLEHVNANMIYVSTPTYGVEVKFVSTFSLILPTDFTVTDTGLTGSGVVTVRRELGFSESYSNVPAAHAPTTGAAVNWHGYLPDTITVTNNIIAKHSTWYTDMGAQKGFGEMKVGNNVLFEGNIFTGQNTGMIFEVKNQGGADPWSSISNVTIRNNLWVRTGSSIALAMTDYTNRTVQAHDFLITNNLFLDPDLTGGDPQFFGNATSGGSDVTITHNTIFCPAKVVFGVSGADYDGPEVSGFSQLHNWIVKDNIFLQRSSFFFPFRSTTASPYNFGDIRDCWPDMTATDNVIIDDTGLGNPSGFFTIHTNNEHPTTIAAVGFTDAPVDLDYTGDYRLTTGSTYHNTASDGTDPGVNYSTLVAALGFDPFGLGIGDVIVRSNYKARVS